jgi:hypothetical protein
MPVLQTGHLVLYQTVSFALIPFLARKMMAARLLAERPMHRRSVAAEDLTPQSVLRQTSDEQVKRGGRITGR